MSDLIEKLDKTLSATEHKLGSVRTGRANPELLSRIMVDCYGSSVPLNQVASVNVQEGTTFILNVFDGNNVDACEKAIQKSDLGLNPQREGSVIRMRLPLLTEDRRKELQKIVGQLGEEAKVSLRNVRRDFMEQIKQDESLSKDDQKREQDNVQSSIDDYSKKIDALCELKNKEIMTI